MDRKDIAVAAASFHGVNLNKHADLHVIATGAGVAMAAADHLCQQYPGLDQSIEIIDLPGSLGVEKRALILDYAANLGSCVFVMVAGLVSGVAYPLALKKRGFFASMPLWVYCSGIEAKPSRIAWRSVGAKTINLWSNLPLGRWIPSQRTPPPGYAWPVPSPVVEGQTQ